MKILILIAIYLYATHLFAFGFFAQPSIGYSHANHRTSLNNDQSILRADETSFELKGPTLGLRLGSHVLPAFSLALDFRYSRLSGEGQGVTSSETKIKRTLGEMTIFPTLIYRPMPFWIWVGAGLYGTYTDSGDYDKDAKQKMETGKSYKMGGAFFFNNAISCNIEFEYVETKRDKESPSYRVMQTASPGTGTAISGIFSLAFLY